MKVTTFLCAVLLTAASLFAQNQVQSYPAPTAGITASQGSLGAGHAWKTLGATAYVATDINGNKHDMGAIFKAGKPIVLDFSTIWCAPCWKLHHSKVLDKLYEKYGAGGSNELVVLWVEGEGASTAEIKGGGEKTMGDWTLGGTWPVPIISDAGMATSLGLIVPTYPSVFLLSPEGTYTAIDNEAWLGGEQGADAVYQAVKEIPKLTDKPRIESIGIPPMGTVVGRTVKLSAQIRSLSPITAYRWTLQGACIPSSTEADPSVSWTTIGTYTISLSVANVNGESQTFVAKVNVVNPLDVTTFPYFNSFDHGVDPNWLSVDKDGDGCGWVALGAVLKPLGVDQSAIEQYAHSGVGCLSSWSFRPVSISGDEWDGDPLDAENYLISPKIIFPADAVKPQISFYIRSLSGASKDWYRVLVSTTGMQVDDFTDEIMPWEGASGEWNFRVIDLDKYKGKSIYVAIVHESSNKLALLLDDLSIGIDGKVGNEPIPPVGFAVSVVGNTIKIEGDTIGVVQIFDTAGRMVDVAEARNGEVVFDSSAYSPGCYVVRLSANGREFVRKVMVR